MSDFVLHMEQERDETPVSNIFLDEYMPTANGAYVKIYLYLLRCMNSGAQSLSVPAIADRFEHTENDVHRALAYWEKMKLLRLEYDSRQALTGICLLEPQHRQTPQTAVTSKTALTTAAPSSSEPAVPSKKAYNADQLARFQEENDIRQLLFICEQYLGKTLSPTEVSTILYFYDGLHFSSDLIEYLIEYCVTKGHKSMRYIESVALGWHKEGYQTAAQAKQECTAYGKTYFAVLKAFGIKGRNPVEPEIRFIDRWTKELGLSLELITEACTRTMAAIHQPSFEYADSILNNWHANQIKSLADVKALDTQRTKKSSQENTKARSTAVKKAAASNRFHNFDQREYDFATLEKQLINH